MEVIPVIDLKGKQVVRAKMGERQFYAPLTPTSAPAEVIQGFLALHPFRTIYVADLDAIEGKGSHDDVLAALQAGFPDLAFWVDRGVRTRLEAETWLLGNRSDLIVGSESWQDPEALAALRADPRVILSLDFRGEAFLGPQALLDDANLWPQRLIVMTLARVGGDAGPDFARLAAIVQKAGARRAYAAGGLRGKDDLKTLRDAGAAGVLVASALHDGRLRREDLADAHLKRADLK